MSDNRRDDVYFYNIACWIVRGNLSECGDISSQYLKLSPFFKESTQTTPTTVGSPADQRCKEDKKRVLTCNPQQKECSGSNRKSIFNFLHITSLEVAENVNIDNLSHIHLGVNKQSRAAVEQGNVIKDVIISDRASNDLSPISESNPSTSPTVSTLDDVGQR